MWRNSHWVLAALLLAVWTYPGRASGSVVAADDATNSPYNDGWAVGDNGGTGFAAWSTINNQVAPTGFGGGFLASNNSFDQVGTGSPKKSFGVFGNAGGIGQAIRSFSNAIAVGDTFSIDMDNGFIDTGNAVGFGLQNASGNNLAEFFFKGGDSFYTLNAANVTLTSATAQGFTDQGLRLQFTLTGATSLSVAIDQLSNGTGVDASYTANLLNPAGDQSITQLRLFNANAGFNDDHNAYFNNFSVVSSVPESTAFCFGGLSCGIVGLAYCCRRMSKTLFSRSAA